MIWASRWATAVMATFFQGTRYCGSAVRIVAVGASDAVVAPPATAVGSVAIEPDAEPPDVTVHVQPTGQSDPPRYNDLSQLRYRDTSKIRDRIDRAYEASMAYLAENGVRTIVSTMTTRHNIAHYEEAGLDWHHVPVPSTDDGADALEDCEAVAEGGEVALAEPGVRRPVARHPNPSISSSVGRGARRGSRRSSHPRTSRATPVAATKPTGKG